MLKVVIGIILQMDLLSVVIPAVTIAMVQRGKQISNGSYDRQLCFDIVGGFP